MASRGEDSASGPRAHGRSDAEVSAVEGQWVGIGDQARLCCWII